MPSIGADQRMLHLHRLDDGETLAVRHYLRPLLHQNASTLRASARAQVRRAAIAASSRARSRKATLVWRPWRSEQTASAASTAPASVAGAMPSTVTAAPGPWVTAPRIALPLGEDGRTKPAQPGKLEAVASATPLSARAQSTRRRCAERSRASKYCAPSATAGFLNRASGIAAERRQMTVDEAGVRNRRYGISRAADGGQKPALLRGPITMVLSTHREPWSERCARYIAVGDQLGDHRVVDTVQTLVARLPRRYRCAGLSRRGK